MSHDLSLRKSRAARISILKWLNRFRLAAWLSFGVPFIVAGPVYYLTAAAGLTWRHGGNDGGDLATATALLGVPHPTGYPLYLLSGRIFGLFVPDPARALTLASACWGALAVGLIGLASCGLSRLIFQRENVFQADRFAAIGGVLSGLAMAFAPLVWSQALIVEVYSLNLALFGLMLVLAVQWWQTAKFNRLALLALVAGLAIGHHHTAIFTVAALTIFVWRISRQTATIRPIFSGRKLVALAGLFGLGCFVPYTYLLLRGGAVPASNWSDVGLTNLTGLGQYFAGSDYQNLLFAAPFSQSLGRVPATLNLLLQQFGVGGIILGWLGLVAAWLTPAARPLLWAALVGMGLHSGFAAVYAAENSQVYLLPAFGFWAVLMGWGLGWALVKLSALLNSRSAFISARIISLIVGVIIALALPLFSLLTNYTRLDLSHDRRAEIWASAELEKAPSAAMLVSYYDAPTFALWYAQYVQGHRHEVALVDGRLINKNWYRRNLTRLYPDLKLPDEAEVILEQLAALNPGRPVIIVQPPPPGETSLP